METRVLKGKIYVIVINNDNIKGGKKLYECTLWIG